MKFSNKLSSGHNVIGLSVIWNAFISEIYMKSLYIKVLQLCAILWLLDKRKQADWQAK